MDINTKELKLKEGIRPDLNKTSGDWSGIDKISKKEGNQLLEKVGTEIAQLQRVLFAEKKNPILIVLQGMDTSGKDGTIRHVFRYVNPGGVHVIPFDRPTAQELSHDYLWRVHRKVPAKGEIAIFDRSHYEDIIAVRVNKLMPKSVWSKRYDHINAFEQMLSDEGVIILKFFLHIDKQTQKERLEQRLENHEKHWKFDQSDVVARANWANYMEAYADVFERCNGSHAPWYLIHSNKRWARNLQVASVLLEKLKLLKMKYPEAKVDPSSIQIK